MTREQCEEAIVGPALVCGIEIEDRLDDRFHETGRHGTGDLFVDSPFGFD